MNRYPNEPGHQSGSDTSKKAANEMRSRAATLRDTVYLHLLTHGPKMADQTAYEIGESILSIRPRFTELRQAIWIYDSGLRGINASGKQAAIWSALTPELRSEVIAELEAAGQSYTHVKHDPRGWIA